MIGQHRVHRAIRHEIIGGGHDSADGKPTVQQQQSEKAAELKKINGVVWKSIGGVLLLMVFIHTIIAYRTG